MEGDLFTLIERKKKFTEEERKLIIKSALIGVKRLHDNDIIHSDLKPDNLYTYDRSHTLSSD